MDSREPLDDCRDYLLDVADRIQQQVAQLRLVLATMRQERRADDRFESRPDEPAVHLEPALRGETVHS